MRRERLSLIYALVLAGLMLALTARALPAWGAESDLDAPDAPVRLMSRVEVRDDFVRLRDLFEPAGDYADRKVARAPAPGEAAELDAVWLWRLAKGFGLDWKPTSTLDSALVLRPSRVIDRETIHELVRQAYFEETGADEFIALDFDQQDVALHIAEEATGGPQLARFTLDRTSGRFNAQITGPKGPEEARSLTLTGRAVRQVEVAVPTARISAGAIIRERDLEIVLMPEARVSRTAVVHADELIGQQARRTLTAGRPIAAASVDAPQLVARNAAVTIELRTANMRLTAQGRALESGAKGEAVRVQNLHSRITIDAVVVGENMVSVIVPDRLAANGGLQ
ncbi:MAG: flagellar basal body P-ring formation chaperone FlgA [Marivibrio sp.]|uniref:flagellar basal body P-ring formation chaperone FlgA n=1 Tax=Marivibrio sp. TaxID=2039719 RepID=UPI0032EE7F02